MNDVCGMVLAAGLGERLRPLTERLPKALVEVGGVPLIDFSLRSLAKAGITDIVVNLHHLGHLIREHLGNGSRHGVRLRYSVEHPLQGSGGGILAARSLLGRGTVVTMNADTIADVDLGEVVDRHRGRDATATLVLRKDEKMEDYGVIAVDEDERVGAFLATRAVATDAALEPFMFTGVQVLEPRVFDYMPAGAPFSITRVTYPKMLLAGERLFGHRFDGRWLTVGTRPQLEAARSALEETG